MHYLVEHPADTSKFIEQLYNKCATADKDFKVGDSKVIDAARQNKEGIADLEAKEKEAILKVPFFKRDNDQK